MCNNIDAMRATPSHHLAQRHYGTADLLTAALQPVVPYLDSHVLLLAPVVAQCEAERGIDGAGRVGGGLMMLVGDRNANVGETRRGAEVLYTMDGQTQSTADGRSTRHAVREYNWRPQESQLEICDVKVRLCC